MSDLSDTKCLACGAQLERVRYFPRQLLTADDMAVEQDYFRQKLRRHNRYLHGWGVVCGCTIEVAPTATLPWQVRVCPGYAVGPQGDDILIDDCVLFDLKTGLQPPDPCTVKWPCPPTGEMPSTESGRNLVYLAVRYAECYTRPVRVHPAGCGCDETSCEYSRVRDAFELKLLWQLPECHVKAKAADAAWCTQLKAQAGSSGNEMPALLAGAVVQVRPAPPLPPCPECCDEPWVVLATLQLPEQQSTAIAQDAVSYLQRRALWSTTAIQTALHCMS